VIFLRSGNQNRPSLRQINEREIGNPIRHRDDNLIAGVENTQKGIVDGLFGAVGDDHLLRRDGHSIIARIIVGYGFS
jgi:hypothetical protein